MRSIISVIVLSLILSCSTFTGEPWVKFADRVYSPCTEKDVPNPVGKWCFRRCEDYKFLSKKCKRFGRIVEEMDKEEIHNKFLSGDWVLIRRDNL